MKDKMPHISEGDRSGSQIGFTILLDGVRLFPDVDGLQYRCVFQA